MQAQDDLQGFLDIINFLMAEANPPRVLTTSYASEERFMSPPLLEYVFPNGPGVALMFMTMNSKLCTAYAQLGVLGTSILFASGDGGVSGSQSQSCRTFIPTFPSGCPLCVSPSPSMSYLSNICLIA